MLSDPHGRMICSNSPLCMRLPVIIITNPVNKFLSRNPNDGTNKEKFFFFGDRLKEWIRSRLKPCIWDSQWQNRIKCDKRIKTNLKKLKEEWLKDWSKFCQGCFTMNNCWNNKLIQPWRRSQADGFPVEQPSSNQRIEPFSSVMVIFCMLSARFALCRRKMCNQVSADSVS